MQTASIIVSTVREKMRTHKRAIGDIHSVSEGTKDTGK